MPVYYDDSRCGAGKTRWAIREMVSRPAFYVYAVDRCDVIADRIAWIKTEAEDRGTKPRIVTINSQDDHPLDVATRIEQAPASHGMFRHVILVITHEGMKMADHGGFAALDAEIIIDEDPCAHEVFSWQVRQSHSLLAMHFRLRPLAEGISEVYGGADAPSATAWEQDDLASGVGVLRRRLARQPVYTSLTSWDAFADGETHQFTWWTTWDIAALDAYRRVTILANNFTNKLTWAILTKSFGVEFIPFRVPDTRVFQSRRVTIEYFGERTRARRTLFRDTVKAKSFLERVFRHIERNSAATNHVYCLNGYQRRRLPGIAVTSKVAGRNDLATLTCASIIYSAKPSRAEIGALGRQFGIDAQQIILDREIEDLLQFVLRTSLRCPDDTRPVLLRVFDREQAEFVSDYLRTQYGYEVELLHVDLDEPMLEPGKRGPKLIGAKPLTNAERQERFKAKKRAEREGDPDYRPKPRGRPRRAGTGTGVPGPG